MTTLNNLIWYHYLIVFLLLVISIIIFTYFHSLFFSLNYKRLIRRLDEKYYTMRVGTLKQKFLALCSKEDIEEDLLEIRILESDLDVELHDFSKEIKVWEDTMTKVEKRGYI